MILVLNCIIDEKAKNAFEKKTVPRLLDKQMPWQHAFLQQIDSIANLEQCAGLLISGSELSASQENPLDEPLLKLIRLFIGWNRPILGICYGHQMLARALAGAQACRRSSTPEFGWQHIKLQKNRLFSGISNCIAAHSHYD